MNFINDSEINIILLIFGVFI